MTDLNNITLPYIVKDTTLFVPGTHNGIDYSKDSIEYAYETTNWKDKRVISLYRDHRDDWAVDPKKPWTGKTIQVGANVADYLGSVRNVRFNNGKIVGDLYIVDRDVATKLSFEDCQFAISPSGSWKGNRNRATEFVIKNFAMVVNPAQKQTYINTAMMNNQQIGIHYFAMSANKENKKEEKMDMDELKQELNETVSGAINPLTEKISQLATEIDEIKREKEEEKTQKDKECKKEEEQKTLKEKEELSGKVAALEKEVEEYKKKEAEKSKKEDKPEEDEEKEPSKEPELAKTITNPKPQEETKMTRTEEQKQFADFLTNLGVKV